MKKLKIKETFEYEVEIENDEDKENIFSIQNYIDCVDDMCCPFWDGYIHPEIYNKEFKILEEIEINN